MQTRNTPVLDTRYWVAISIASILGANLGDLFAHDLGLGHTAGLLPLAIAFLVILLAERFSGYTTEAFYWLAILTLRTAATNLGDFGTHDLKLSPPLLIAGLALLLVIVWLFDRIRRSGETEEDRPLGGTDAPYWLAMLVAGTLGTVLGDYLADEIGLGVACVVTVPVLAACVSARVRLRMSDRASYWAAIVAVRTAGTNVGDYFAFRRGLGLGLRLDAALMALVLLMVLLAWRRAAAPADGATTI